LKKINEIMEIRELHQKELLPVIEINTPELEYKQKTMIFLKLSYGMNAYTVMYYVKELKVCG